MDKPTNENIKDHIRDSLDSMIDLCIAELNKDNYYSNHKTQLQRSIMSNNVQSVLEHQMTMHNMELEAVYRAGYRDCILYFKEINTEE